MRSFAVARSAVPLAAMLSTCFLLLGCGGAAAPDSTHTFAYVYQPAGLLDSDPNKPFPAQIAGFGADPGTGVLTPLGGSPFSAPALAPPGEPAFIATSDGHFLYLGACTDLAATRRADCTTTAFAVRNDGSLSQRATQSVTGTDDMQVVGNFMYAFDSQIIRTQILGFQVGPDGRLSPVPGVAPPVDAVIQRIRATPSRRFLYVAINAQTPQCMPLSCEDVLLMGYSINQNTGVLTPLTGFPIATPLKVAEFSPPWFTGMFIDGQSRFLYLTGESTPDVVGFAIDPNTGALTALPGPLAKMQTTVGAASPDGKFLFLGLGITIPQNAPGVDGFSIGSSGRLTPVQGSPLTFNANDVCTGCPVTVDPTSHFLYFISRGINELNIGPDGAISNPQQSFALPGPPGRFSTHSVLIVTRTP